MAQNSFFMDAIDHEAMQVVPMPTVITASLARNIALKTTQTLLTTSSNHFVCFAIYRPPHESN